MKNIGSYPAVRLRRNRKNDWSRRLVSENNLSTNDLIWPIFIREGKNIKEPIKSLPGVYRYSIDKLEKLVESALDKSIPMIALFPFTEKSKKNVNGTEALNKNNLICKALRLIKKNYQMDIKNSLEAIREVSLDVKEGADFVMVKPGLPYLDIIKLVKENFKIPVLAYQVSGEYSLIRNGINKGIIDKNTIIEVLTGFKRAGANAVVTYFANKVAKDLQ